MGGANDRRSVSANPRQTSGSTLLMSAAHLIELASQVRGATIQIVAATNEDSIDWAPPGTSNHIRWHAGHVLWLQDALCIRLLSQRSELPFGWSEQFGMNSVSSTHSSDAPSRDQLVELLEEQLARMLSLMEINSDRLRRIGKNPKGHWNLTRGIIHALHDESRHQGEMYLLTKMLTKRAMIRSYTK